MAMDEGGRGLSVIEILGSRWGYYASTGGGKVVWCEIGYPVQNSSFVATWRWGPG